MNKTSLLKHILSTLESVHQVAIDAAIQASATATDKESVAENKYDTFGLEASYLAHGQAKRVAECEADVAAFRNINAADFTDKTPISVGALITLEHEDGSTQTLLLGPAAGGLKIRFEGKDIIVITRSSSLGAALYGRIEGDDIEIDIDNKKAHYEIMSVV